MKIENRTTKTGQMTSTIGFVVALVALAALAVRGLVWTFQTEWVWWEFKVLVPGLILLVVGIVIGTISETNARLKRERETLDKLKAAIEGLRQATEGVKNTAPPRIGVHKGSDGPIIRPLDS